ncbi:MAG: hypothetical protein WCQ16_08405 [Verrucomicrobiae bacterium]
MRIFSRNRIARLTGADHFVLALDHMMSRHGQHGLIGQTHVRLESVPDIARLGEAARRLAEAYPLLDAEVRRNPFTLRVAWHRGRGADRSLPVNLWFENGARVPGGRRATEIPSESDWVDHVLNEPSGFRDGLRNLRLDLLLLGGGGSLLALTWKHLLFDGKGAELLLDALVNPAPPSSPPAAPARRSEGLRELIRLATPIVKRFFELAANRYSSLAGPRPLPGRLRFRMLTFDTEATARIQARSDAAAGPLFRFGFYLACALRAHRQAFLARGSDPAHFLVSLPVQVRKKGLGNTPFQNCVTILFFSLDRESLASLESAARAVQAQFEEMTRAGLDRSFTAVLELMSFLPSPVYLRFLRWQFRSEITSFFHSFTGEFSAKLADVFGARVTNAFHIPSVSAPPGSGLFFGLFNGRLNATFSWREGSVGDDEAGLVLARLQADLLGEEVLPPRECVPT